MLREKGAQDGCIDGGEIDETAATPSRGADFPGLAGMDLAKVVSCDQAVSMERGTKWALGKATAAGGPAIPRRRI